MAERAERAFLTIDGSTSAKPYGCEFIAKRYADMGSAKTKDVSSLIGIFIILPIFKDDCIMKKLRFISIKLSN
jgi:hypothetical protein